jgi:hypothetical protein
MPKTTTANNISSVINNIVNRIISSSPSL